MGDARIFFPNADLLEEGYALSAAISRGPEARSNLGRGPPTDIWSHRAAVRNWIGLDLLNRLIE